MAGELVPQDPFRLAQANFKRRLKFWNKFFETASEAQISNNRKYATDELNSLWGYRGLMGKECYVRGEGLWTETIPESQLDQEAEENALINMPGPDSMLFTVIRYGPIIGVRAFSEGLNLSYFKDRERPQLTYQFAPDDAFSIEGFTFNFRIDHHIQVKLGTLSLIPVLDMQLGLEQISERFEPQAAHN